MVKSSLLKVLFLLCQGQLLGKESNGQPLFIVELVKNSASGVGGGIPREASIITRSRKGK